MRTAFVRQGIALLLAILSLSLASWAAYVNPPYLEEITGDGWVCGNWAFVQVKPGYSQSDLATAVQPYSAVVEEAVPGVDNCYIVSWNKTEGAVALFTTMSSLLMQEHVAYNHAMDLCQIGPYEQLYPDQWNFNDTQTPSFDINQLQASRISRGNSGVSVYLMDSGFPGICHPDFGPNMAWGPWHVTPVDPDPNRCRVYGPEDNFGHATAMATVIDAQWTDAANPNGYYVGVAPNVTLIAGAFVQAHRPSLTQNFRPFILESDAVYGLWWAWAMWNPAHFEAPIKVIVAPWGSPIVGWSPMEQQVRHLLDHDVMVVAATGNVPCNMAHNIFFPAGYAAHGWDANYPDGYPNLLACTAYQRNGEAVCWARNYFWNSELHPEVLISAPCGTTDPGTITTRTTDDIAVDFPETCTFGMIAPDMYWTGPMLLYPQPAPESARGRFTGTSFSAAQVGAVAGVIFSLNSAMTPNQVRTQLINTATPTDNPTQLGAGRLDALRAVLATPASTPFVLADNMTIESAIGNVYIATDITVPANKTLTIQPGVTLTFAQGKRITVSPNGHLVANGTEANHIVFQGEGTGAYGFELYNGAQTFNYCDFDNVGLPLRAHSGAVVTASNCVFTNVGAGALVYGGSVVNLTDCDITSQGGYGIVTCGRLTVTGGSITSAIRSGIWSVNGSTTVDGTDINNNGDNNWESFYDGGVRNFFSHLNFHCAVIHGNYGPGLSAFGGFTSMGGGSHGASKSVISDNWAHTGMPRTQIYFSNAQWTLCNGRNRICASDGELIIDANPLGGEITGNCWCGSTAYPPEYYNGGDDLNCDWNRCNLPHWGNCTLDGSEPAYYYHIAWEQENTMLYDDAIVSYRFVMEHYPSSKEALLCPGRITFCEKYSGMDFASRRAYFLAAADTTTDLDLKYECRASAAWCLVEMDHIPDAQNEFMALLDQSDTYYKQEKTSLMQAMIDLESPPWDGKVAPDGVQPDHAMIALDRMEEVLGRGLDDQISAEVPGEFGLYQNYPNPFNPVTEIRFDLPAAANVELKVFNSLGQLVATLASGPRAAGAHRVSWDASQHASGLYIYQLKAGELTAARKMLLMK